MTMYLPLGSIMEWSSKAEWLATETTHRVTEHNRQPLAVSYEDVGGSGRMADATLRKFIIARKRTWSTSWGDLPSIADKTVDGRRLAGTVDGHWGADEIETF